MQFQSLANLVERARQGDQAAFGELVALFQPPVFSVVLRRLGNRSEAVEATQDVFMQALRKLPQLREPERFAGWLRQIAVRMSINRAMRRPHEAACSPHTFVSMKTEPRDPLQDILRAEQAGQVRSGLETLRSLDRETLLAFYFEGRSLKEMSDQFKSPVGTIKRRLHTARNRLRDELVALQPA